MDLRFKVSPQKYEFSSFDELMNEVVGDRVKITNEKGSYYSGGGKIRLFNVQKFNSKFRKVKNDAGELESVKIRDKSWVAHVYDIDESLVEAMGLNVNQLDKTFDVFQPKQ